MRAALGMKARTGRAIFVVVAGTREEPVFVERTEVKLLPDGAFAPYHAAENLEPGAARASVKRDIAAAHGLAESAIRAAAKRAEEAGHRLVAGGVLVGNAFPDWTTEEIIAVHVRMHMAEGVLFRDVLVVGAKACGLQLITLDSKAPLAAAARALNVPKARLEARIAALGKAAGAPWAQHQKEAAAAAVAALGAAKP